MKSFVCVVAVVGVVACGGMPGAVGGGAGGASASGGGGASSTSCTDVCTATVATCGEFLRADCEAACPNIPQEGRRCIVEAKSCEALLDCGNTSAGGGSAGGGSAGGGSAGGGSAGGGSAGGGSAGGGSAGGGSAAGGGCVDGLTGSRVEIVADGTLDWTKTYLLVSVSDPTSPAGFAPQSFFLGNAPGAAPTFSKVFFTSTCARTLSFVIKGAVNDPQIPTCQGSFTVSGRETWLLPKPTISGKTCTVLAPRVP